MRAFDAATARLETLVGEPHISSSYIRFRLGLIEAQQAARAALAPMQPGPSATEPWPLGPDDVPFPTAVLARVLEAMRTAAATHGTTTEDMQRIVTAVAEEPEVLATLARAAAFGPDMAALESVARRWGVLVDAVHFVGRALAAPCVAASVASMSAWTAPPAEGEPHRCPACGSRPSIARLRREDGGRTLTCGLCGAEWRAVRLACPCCGARETSSLAVLRIDEPSARWVETCEACRGYIKTVDERRLAQGETVLAVVEESATMHLDLLAEREGYARRAAYVLGG